MKIIKQDVKLIENPINNFCQWIEKIGRVCYKSEDQITDDSANNFILKIFKNGHLSVLEHLNIILKLPYTYQIMFKENEFQTNKFFEISKYGSKYILVSGNLRTFYEIVFDYRYNEKNRINRMVYRLRSILLRIIFDTFRLPKLDAEITGLINRWFEIESFEKVRKEFEYYEMDFLPLDEIRNLSNEDKLKHLTATFYVMTDRGVSHEFVRHRVAAYSQSSTRYCNYSKGKFGGEITVILPVWFGGVVCDKLGAYREWEIGCFQSEQSYLNLIELGQKPQQARQVLNNSLMTEFYVTMRLREWQHFLKLRTSENAHPQMREIAGKIRYCLRNSYPEIFVKN